MPLIDSLLSLALYFIFNFFFFLLLLFVIFVIVVVVIDVVCVTAFSYIYTVQHTRSNVPNQGYQLSQILFLFTLLLFYLIIFDLNELVASLSKERTR